MEELNIAFISIDRVVNKVMADQLRQIFGSFCGIKGLLLEENEVLDVDDCCLAVCSNQSIVAEAKRKMNKEIPVFGAKRTINMQNISEINGIESGTDVIVVSNGKASALETIDILHSIGINHLNMIPYYEDCKEKITDIAITPGGLHAVPRGVKKVIDLGVKNVSLATIMEVFSKLGTPTSVLDRIIEKSNQDIIRANHYNSEINSYLQGIFETIHDGVAVFNEYGDLTLCSKRFTDFLDMNYTEALSKNYQTLFHHHELCELIKQEPNIYDEIVTMKQRRMVVNKRKFENHIRGFIISMQDITIIQQLENKVRKKMANKGFVAKYTFSDVIGESDAIKRNIEVAKKIAESDFSVLIQGNNGTGKEIFAQAIHSNSGRRNGPFIAVNLASLSDDLIESELFGYEEGAFTGAMRGGKKGLFEMAHNGTIFIDEIGDISQRIQQRLLRVLQEKEILKIGGKSIIPIDTRIIAASNVDLYESVQEKKFRIDLYYRLNILQFKLPDLKERLDDIELLAKYFFKSVGSEKFISGKVLKMFKKYSWPGNVRELENLVYYFDSIVDHNEIVENDLPEFFLRHITEKEDPDQVYKMDVHSQFPNENIYRECMAILELMNQMKDSNMVLSRKLIRQILEKNQISLSQEQIRNRTEKLRVIGLIHIGKTKQGSMITEAGVRHLRAHREKDAD